MIGERWREKWLSVDVREVFRGLENGNDAKVSSTMSTTRLDR